MQQGMLGVVTVCSLLSRRSMCTGINVILREKFDKELHGDDQCFDNKAQLVEGCWTLVAAGLIQVSSGLCSRHFPACYPTPVPF